jgi:hypothetical protein
MGETTQDVQKGHPARPQRVKVRGVPSGYVEDLNDARTTLGDFFNVLLIEVADSAPVNQLQKLQPGLRLTAEGAQH